MPLKNVSRPMTDAELEVWESTRDLEAELIESARQMAEGKTHGKNKVVFFQNEIKTDVRSILMD